MDLFKLLKIPTDCLLCGGTVFPIASDLTTSNAQITETLAPILCRDCHCRLPLSRNTCSTCGLPVSHVTQSSSVSNINLSNTAIHSNTPIYSKSQPCGECLTNSPPYDRTISAFHYEYPINEFITQLKFSAQFQLLPLLCDYLIQKIEKGYINQKLPTVIIPIPLHPKKLIQRGFNQSNLLADRIAKSFDITVLSNIVNRTKNTQFKRTQT